MRRNMKRALLIAILIAGGLLFTPFNDCALTAYSGDELKLYIGHTKILSVSNPSRIAIGNPEVVDVIHVTKDELTLSPKAPGKTTLVFWDNFGEQSFTVKVFAEDILDAKRRIDNMLSKLDLPEVKTVAEEEEGKVVLLGRVKTPQDKERISIALGQLQGKTIDLINVKEEESVIEIDVHVLELSQDATDTLGFTWPGAINITEVGSAGLSAAGTTWGKLFHVLNVQRFSGGAADPFTLTLDALVQEGKARVLSRPRLACQSGKEAELLVGGEKPIFTTSVESAIGTSSTEVDYKEYGIKLKIKPTVSKGDRIKLALNVEVSEVGTAEIIGAANAPTAKAYPLTKRTASTELFLGDGQTMAIGGLIKQKTEEQIRKVPFLGDIPILGAAFRKKITQEGGGFGEKGNTELFITLTPRIVSREQVVQEQEEPRAKEIIYLPAAGDETSSLPGSVVGYATTIQKRIVERLSYPMAAKQAGFQGTTLLSLRLSYKGDLLETALKSSSDYKVLDDNAIAVAKSIASYPPFPSSIKEKEIWVDVPIVYRLD